MGEKSIFEGKVNGAIFAIIICLLWGSTYPVMKLSYAALSVSTPFEAIQLAGIRFTISGILVLAYSFLKGKASLRLKKLKSK